MTSSNVSLSTRSDCFGRPLAAVNWQVGGRERETLLALALEIDAYLALNRIGRVAISAALRQPGDAWKSGLRDNQHHVGTARMAASERHGVVDSNGKIFRLANLYVSGGAVIADRFARESHPHNDSLGFRLAAHLATRREPCQLRVASVTLIHSTDVQALTWEGDADGGIRPFKAQYGLLWGQTIGSIGGPEAAQCVVAEMPMAGME